MNLTTDKDLILKMSIWERTICTAASLKGKIPLCQPNKKINYYAYCNTIVASL